MHARGDGGQPAGEVGGPAVLGPVGGKAREGVPRDEAELAEQFGDVIEDVPGYAGAAGCGVVEELAGEEFDDLVAGSRAGVEQAGAWVTVPRMARSTSASGQIIRSMMSLPGIGMRTTTSPAGVSIRTLWL